MTTPAPTSPDDGAPRPRIGLSANLFPPEDRPLFKGKALFVAERSMVESVRSVGGLPVVVPFADDPAEIQQWASLLDGLLLTGGADLAPESYGESPERPAWAGQRERDVFEIALYHACRALDLPVLGICRGAQLLNVAEGGTLWQDLLTCRPDSLLHRDPIPYDQLGHDVRVEEDSQLAGILSLRQGWVNSVHHQGLRAVAPSLRAVAFAPDGVVEAVEHRESSEVLAVQWHPEWMYEDAAQSRLFGWLVERARARARRA